MLALVEVEGVIMALRFGLVAIWAIRQLQAFQVALLQLEFEVLNCYWRHPPPRRHLPIVNSFSSSARVAKLTEVELGQLLQLPAKLQLSAS